MASVTRQPAIGNRTVDDQVMARILRIRPYHPWHLIPLAAYLCVEGYSDAARAQIVDAVDEGHFLESLVVLRLLEPADLVGAREALEAGRRQRAARRLTTLTVEPFMPGADEPDPFDEVLALDAEFDQAEMRAWYDSHGSFSAWLEREGGPA